MTHRRPVQQAAFPSASRAVNTYYSNEYDNSAGHRGVVVFTDLTVRGGGGTGTLAVTIEGYDYTSGKWYTMIAGTTISSVTTQTLLSYPGATVVANQVGQWPLPGKWRVKAVVAADVVTFSIGAEVLD